MRPFRRAGRCSHAAMSPVVAPGVKTFSMPAASSAGMSSAGMIPPREDQDVAGAALAQRRHDLGEQRHVRARVAREPDRVGVLLDRGLGDLLGRLVQARVDHLEPGVAQGARDHLGPAVVPVEARLRHDDAVLPGHGPGSLAKRARAAPGLRLHPARRRMPHVELHETRYARAADGVLHRVPGRRRGPGRPRLAVRRLRQPRRRCGRSPPSARCSAGSPRSPG